MTHHWTLTLKANDGVSQDPLEIPDYKHDDLTLDVQIEGYFCYDQALYGNDFTPPLPCGKLSIGKYKGYKPNLDKHSTEYTWDSVAKKPCPDSHHRGHNINPHTIHTGN